MNLTRKRWLLLAISCAICFCAGSIYAWSVFAGPLAARLSAITGTALTPGDLASAFALANAVGPIPMILGGAVTDRWGPRPVIMTGGLLMGAGLVLSGLATSIPMLLVSYGLLFGLGLGLTYGCVINNTLKFFPDHRGLVGGLTTAIYGSCSVLLPPVANVAIEALGVTASLELFGWVFGAVIVAGGFFSMKCPAGFLPEGMAAVAKKAAPASKRDVDWRGMVSTPVFWAMAAMLLCGAVSGMMILSQAATIAQQQAGMTVAAAAAAVSILALANTAGRLLAGVLSDKLGRLAALCSAVVLQMAGLFCLIGASAEAVPLFYAGIVATGVAFGSFMGVFPGFTADEFGTSHNAVNYGIMFAGFAVAGTVGPTLMRSILAGGGSYASCYLAALVISGAGLVFSLAYRMLAKRAEKAAA